MSLRGAESHLCLGALGAGATLGLRMYGPQLFAQLPRASAGQDQVPQITQPAVQGPEPPAVMGVAPVLGLGVTGASLLAARAARGRPSRRPLRAFEGELGVQAPFGYWDPAGLSKDGDADDFRRRRETEIKHGRVSMVACMGYIVPEYYKFPGYVSPTLGVAFRDVPNGLGALSKVPEVGWLQIFLFAGLVELGLYKRDPTRGPGDFKYGGVLGTPNASGPILDDALRKRKLNAELANGRLAMVAIIGMFFQDGLTGSAWGDWSLYTDSPLRAFEGELGVQAPFGYWDPAGLSKDGDADDFRRRRETEIKHGRVSMVACMGYIVPEYYKFPGYVSPTLGVAFRDVPNGLGALSKVPEVGWLQIFLFAGLVELGLYKRDPARGPGDFKYGGILGTPNASGPILDDALRRRKLNAELANGRLAMVAIIGMFFQDGLTGSAWGDWSLYTDSPLRAFETELGVQAPFGFWDPLGYAKDGDADAFRRRRISEIKHGRISMLATMGYMTPELVGKFPGYLSPKMGLKFADIPNGLAAVSKVPGLGWVQILAYCAYCEASSITGELDGAEPGDYGYGKDVNPLAVDDPELRRRRLNAELANGRLAMMAIIGMFFQDGLTGSAWGDWSLYTDSPLRASGCEPRAQAP